MVLSLKKFIDSAEYSTPDTVRIAELFLQGIQVHACQLDDLDYARFRSNIANLIDSLADRPKTGDLILTTGAALQAMSDYNQGIGRQMRALTTELHSIIKMLSETLRTLAKGSERQIGKLEDIEGQIQRASQVSDLHTLKGKLEGCLGDLREALANERENASRMEHVLQAGIEHGVAALSQRPDIDPATGLPGPDSAQREMQAALNERKTCYAAVFHLSRLGAVNARFGHEVGNRILLHLSERLAGSMGTGDKLFRWHGPAFLMTIARKAPIDSVRAEVARLSSVYKEENLQIGNRTVLLSVSTNTVVVPVHECRDWEEIRQKLSALPGVST